jgi:methyl-accepting chemotaxis protein
MLQDKKPLEQMTREELIEEVQRGCVVVGEHQAEIEIRNERMHQLEQKLELADAEIRSTRLQRDDAIETIEVAAREHDAEIEQWKQRCRQEIACKVQCQQSFTSVVEERDDLKEHIRRLEAELARSYTNVKSVFERWTVGQKRMEKLQEEMYDLEEDNAALKERIAQLQTTLAAGRGFPD